MEDYDYIAPDDKTMALIQERLDLNKDLIINKEEVDKMRAEVADIKKNMGTKIKDLEKHNEEIKEENQRNIEMLEEKLEKNFDEKLEKMMKALTSNHDKKMKEKEEEYQEKLTKKDEEIRKLREKIVELEGESAAPADEDTEIPEDLSITRQPPTDIQI